jgi:hypothetical protein
MNIPSRRIDLNLFSIPEEELSSSRRPRAHAGVPQPQKGERYFGPVPMGWLARAAPLPGRSWHLACAVWFELSCLQKRTVTVRLSSRTRRWFGLTTDTTFRRALNHLERAGLIRVKRLPGHCPRITILG